MAVTLVTGDDGSNVRVGGPGDDLIYGFDPDGPQGNVTSIAATRVATVPGGRRVRRRRRPAIPAGCSSANLDGTVRILDLTTGQLLPTPFINIASSIGVIGEGGLIGFAFDPNYAQQWLSSTSTSPMPSDDTEIRRYQVSATDPNHARSREPDVLLRIDQPDGLTNHKGGWVEFGPDGYLYAALGDGGGGGDPTETGQNINDLLGNILRLDVHGDDFPARPEPQLCGAGRQSVRRDDRGRRDLGLRPAQPVPQWLRSRTRRSLYRAMSARAASRKSISDIKRRQLRLERVRRLHAVRSRAPSPAARRSIRSSPMDAVSASPSSAAMSIAARARACTANISLPTRATARSSRCTTMAAPGVATDRTAQITPDTGSINVAGVVRPGCARQPLRRRSRRRGIPPDAQSLSRPTSATTSTAEGGNDMLFGGSGNDTLHGGIRQ